jgi:putative ABC transport system substrate-binding protein
VRRRTFITLLGCAAAWPLAARAQQPGGMGRIGFLGTTTPSAQNQWIAKFAQRLRELGWTEGHNIAIDVRWADGRSERYAEIATEFVQRKVHIIVTSGAAVVAAKQATSIIPIAFAVGVTRSAPVTSFAPGRQRHRPVGPDTRPRRKTTRTLARDSPRPPSLGDHSQHR